VVERPTEHPGHDPDRQSHDRGARSQRRPAPASPTALVQVRLATLIPLNPERPGRSWNARGDDVDLPRPSPAAWRRRPCFQCSDRALNCAVVAVDGVNDRRGVRVRRPTRPAGRLLRLAGQMISVRHGTTTWTWLHTPRRRDPSRIPAVREVASAPSAGEAKAVVGVTVRRRVPVTVRRADVRRLIVERPAPQETRVWPPPAGTAFYETGRSAVDRCWHGAHAQSSS